MARTFIKATLALLFGGLAFTSFTGIAQADQEPGLADIVFTSGGRVLSMKADGSNREVLTRPGGRDPFMVDDRLVPQDDQPSVSPDGSKLVFLRWAYSESDGRLAWRVMTANRDGSDQEVLQSISPGMFAGSLDWTADGEAIIYSEHAAVTNIPLKNGWPQAVKLLTLGEKKPRTIFFRTFNGKTADGFGRQLRSLRNFSLSPDEKLLVYESWDGGKVAIQLLDRRTKRTRKLASDAVQPSFSADGKTVLFAGATKAGGLACHAKCPPGGLFTIPVSGGEPRRIVATAGSIEYPRFSPDGSQIVFASNRNFPVAQEDAFEVYSIRTDGTCLTWLTNGSPGSHSPSWGPEPGADTSPGNCGQRQRDPLVEYRPDKMPPNLRINHYWAGLEVGGRLLSAPPVSFWSAFEYGDCGYFDRSDCSGQIGIQTSHQCSSLAPFVNSSRTTRVVERRGVPVARTWNRQKNLLSGAIVTTGKSDVYIGRMFWYQTLPWAKKPTFAEQLQVVDALRVYPSAEANTGDLPPAKISRSSLQYLRGIRETYRRTGSLRVTARKFDLTPAWVRTSLKWFEGYERVGPIRTFDCPSRKGRS